MLKIVDKRNRSEPGEYAVSFAERDAQGSYDHAFVLWYYSDPNGQRTVRRGAGFYPAGGDLYDLIIGGAPGKVLDDSKEKIAKQLIVLVNSEIFQVALEVESRYKDATYRLFSNDCVSFVAKVAESVPRLNMPNPIANILPTLFISALYNSN